MKRIFFIVQLVLLLVVVSCVEPIAGLQNPFVKPVEEGMPVKVTFGITTTDVQTKALAERPDIRSLHVFLFNAQGVLLAAEKAEYTPIPANAPNSGNGPQNAQPWSVNLPMGTAERHLHFVANLGNDYELPEVGSEVSIIRSLETTNGVDAYWQRVDLPEGTGIGAYTYNGTGYYVYVNPETGEARSVEINAQNIYGFISKTGESPNISYTYRDPSGVVFTVNPGDYINVNGLKIINGEGLYASQSTSDEVKAIPLIRNFARIKVSSAATSNFTLTRAVLVNVPVAGYIAAYDDRDGHNRFVAGYMAAGTTPPDRAAIEASGYPATIPSNSGTGITNGIVTTLPAESTFTTAVNQSATLYMYERGVPDDHATAILVGGTMEGIQGTRWFKIDVAKTSGEHFPIYRDFTYVFTIESINGTSGYDTPQKAFENAAVGDISSSPETKTLTRIDDGKGLSLWVEYIDHTSTSSTTTTKRLLYKFVYTSGTTTTNLTSSINPTLNPYTGYGAAVSSFTTPVAYERPTGQTNWDTPDGQGGWYTTTVTLPAAGGSLLKSDIHIEGTYETSQGGIITYTKTLSRDVTFRVMPKQDLGLHCTGLANQEFEKETELTITLPANVLGISMFPLTLEIEALDDNLNPADSENLSVSSGPSRFNSASTSKNNFFFQKVVSFATYEAEGGNVVVVKFKTIRAGSATSSNATWIAVSDAAGNFNTAYIQVKIGQTSDGEAYTP